MWKSVVLYCTLLAWQAASLSYDSKFNLPPKKIKTSADRIHEHGYPVESHFVETVDGYVLNVFRIPYSPKLNNKADKDKPVVLIKHGLFGSSDVFLLNGPENALSYNFADAGFDVWLANARGTIYSRNNTKISSNQADFWSFSWHEIGVIDLPAMIDYALKKSGQKSLHYVGHSEGTTVFFVMASLRLKYNAKIKTAHLLAPEAFLGNTTGGFFAELAPYAGKPGTICVDLCENEEFLPIDINTACSMKPISEKYCNLIAVMFAGGHGVNFNTTIEPEFLETFPAGCSSNQVIHYIQLMGSNKFRMFDHGLVQNRRLYGQDTPPDYPLEKISAPMFIYYSFADYLAKPEDVQRLQHYLKTIFLFKALEDPTWTHTDFIFATQVKKFVNDPVIGACLEFEKNFNASQKNLSDEEKSYV